MKVRLFYHSLVSDWNHGNAHFLRGVAAELQSRGHDVLVLEPEDGWSRTQLLAERGTDSLRAFEANFPGLRSVTYNESHPRVDHLLAGADLVLVHEWTAPAVVGEIARYRRNHNHVRVLFHDTHHRAITAPEEMARYAMADFDGALVYGKSLKETYERNGWSNRIYVWHEAADTRMFHPYPDVEPSSDFVWIGNWGDGERTAELEEFIFGPVEALSLNGSIFGVRYPKEALARLSRTALQYRGWLPNYEAPRIFAQHRFTVHVPRGPYVKALPGIPTIRPFEALACGIPLVSAPWDDAERLFRPGEDYLIARDGRHMQTLMRDVLNDRTLADHLRTSGLETIRKRHTCSHRVDELLEIYKTIAPPLSDSQPNAEGGRTCELHSLARA